MQEARQQANGRTTVHFFIHQVLSYEMVHACSHAGGEQSLASSVSSFHNLRWLYLIWLGWKTNQTLHRPVLLRARNCWREGASGIDTVHELCSGCTTIWFLGAYARLYDDDDSRLSAMITLLRRRHG
jgi:hypothetical protein